MQHGHHTAASVEPNTKTSTAPGKPSTIREFERSLRTLGYSQREAKAIAMGGFRALRSDAGELSQIVEKLEELADIFRKQ